MSSLSFADWRFAPRAVAVQSANPWFRVSFDGAWWVLLLPFLVRFPFSMEGWIVFFPCVALFVALEMAESRRRERVRPTELLTHDQMAAMLDLPKTQDQFPVFVMVCRGKRFHFKTLGADVGIITLSGDLLHFEGQATSFDLCSDHDRTREFYYRADRDRPFLHIGEDTKRDRSEQINLSWMDAGSEGKLLIVPYFEMLPRPSCAKQTFLRALVAWSNTSATRHTRLNLPPLAPRA